MGGIGEALDSLTSVGEADVVAMSQTATASIVASGVRLLKGGTPYWRFLSQVSSQRNLK